MINLYSDTQTRPTAAMREAIASAEVADEQRRQDPTTLRLEERVAELLGHEAAVFMPSGTMCNQIAFRLHARPGGDEMILDRSSHPIIAEAGGPAMNASLMINPLDGERGVFTAEQLRAAIRPESRYLPRSRLVSVEQTTNMGGGRVWPLETLQAVVEVARDAGPARAHGRRPLDERRRRRRRAGGRLRVHVRHRLDRLHERARGARSARCSPGRPS